MLTYHVHSHSDTGMVDEISGDLKTGLVDLILGIYEFDPTNKDTTKDVLRAAEKMGILNPQVRLIATCLGDVKQDHVRLGFLLTHTTCSLILLKMLLRQHFIASRMW